MRGKVEDVAYSRGTKRIDRLRIITNHCQPAPVRLEREQDRGLQAVRVLILVDQDVIEAPADFLREGALGQHMRPVKQEIVVIEHVLALLHLDIGGEQFLQFRRPVRAPRKRLAENFIERSLGVHRARIDRKARALLRETAFGARETEFVPHQIDQVGRILAVVDGERAIESDALGIFAQEPRTDRMEGSGPDQPRARIRT